MAYQKELIDGVYCLTDTGDPGVPITDVTGDGGDIIVYNADKLRALYSSATADPGHTHTVYIAAAGTVALTGDWTTGAYSIIGSDHWYLRADNAALYFGAGNDATILYDGTNLVVNPKAVGSGVLSVTGNARVYDRLYVSSGTIPANAVNIAYDGGELRLNAFSTSHGVRVDTALGLFPAGRRTMPLGTATNEWGNIWGLAVGSSYNVFTVFANTDVVFKVSDTVEAVRIKATTGNVGIGETVPDYKLDVNGSFGFTPGSSVTPVDNGDVVIEATNDTTLTFKLKGSDGTVRSGTVALA